MNYHGDTCNVRYSHNFICISSFLNILNSNDTHLFRIYSALNFLSLLVCIILIECFKIIQEMERYQIE